MDDNELKAEFNEVAHGVDRAIGFLCGLAAFVAAIPGADAVNVAVATAEARKLCPSRLARYAGDDPKTFAAEMVQRLSQLAQKSARP